jgi:hypothetical protein
MTHDDRDRILANLMAEPSSPRSLRYLFGTVDMDATIEDQLDKKHTEPRELAVFKVGGGAYHQALAFTRPDSTHIEGVLGGTFFISLN